MRTVIRRSPALGDGTASVEKEIVWKWDDGRGLKDRTANASPQGNEGAAIRSRVGKWTH